MCAFAFVEQGGGVWSGRDGEKFPVSGWEVLLG